jgi:predicted RNA methylase
VSELLTLAGVTADSVVCDVGCGDGRVAIAAAVEKAARGVGIESDAAVFEKALQRKREACEKSPELKDKIELYNADFTQADDAIVQRALDRKLEQREKTIASGSETLAHFSP